MKERKLTVYYGRGDYNREAPPQILLQGKWLGQAGFSAGDKITVDCQQGKLIITKNMLGAATEKENGTKVL